MSRPGDHRSTWKELVALEEACCSSIRLLESAGQMATSASIQTLLVAGLQARDLSLRQVKHALYRLRDDGQVESVPVDDEDRDSAWFAGKPLPPNVKVWRLL